MTYCPKSIVNGITASRGLPVSDAVGASTRRFEHRVEVVVEQVSNVAWIPGVNNRITTSPSLVVWNGGLLESRSKRRPEFLSTSTKQFRERLEEFVAFG